MKLFVVAAVVSVVAAPLFGATQVIEEIVAKVNGDIITLGDLEKARHDFREQLQQQSVPALRMQALIAEHNKDYLRDRIDQLLLVQKGKDLDLKVDNDVSRYLADLQKKVGESDPDKFHEMIRQQTGMSYQDFRQEVTNNMLTERVVRQEVGRYVSVDPKEAKEYYEAHKADFVRDDRVYLREILVSSEGKGDAAAEKKADQLVKRARNGEAFPDLARDNSDAATAKSGGDLGGYKKGELAANVEQAVWSQPAGYIADPIKVAKGYLILKVDSHQKAGQESFEEAEDEINQRLAAPRMAPAVRKYLTKLRTTAFLEIKKGFVDTGAAPGKDTAWMDTAQLRPETISKEEVAKEKPRHKRMLGIPIPGTSRKNTSSSVDH